MSRGYWLLKSEPAVFSITDLAMAPGQRTAWEGVRNYQARNFLRDQMRQGDQAFFYHSGTAHPAIVGIVDVVREGYPDQTALDPTSAYYDAASLLAQPRWYQVDVRLIRTLHQPILLAKLKQFPEPLADFALLRRGNRLSVLPVTAAQWAFILELEGIPSPCGRGLG